MRPMIEGYLLLAVSIAAGTVKGYLGKKTSVYAENETDAVFLNSVRILICALISGVLACVGGNIANIASVEPGTIAVSAMNGASTAVFIVSWLLAVKTGAFMLVNVFLNLGLVVPLVMCSVLYGDKVLPVQWIGVIVLLFAAYLMVGYNVGLNGKMKIRDFVLLFICAFSSGLGEFFVGKAFVELKNNDSNAVFNFYTYLFGFVVLIVVFLFFRNFGNKEHEKLKTMAIRLKSAYFMVSVMALCLFLNTYFKTEAGRFLSSVQLYPVSIGVSLICSTLVAAVFFKERPNKKCIVGVALNFAALIIINVIPKLI